MPDEPTLTVDEPDAKTDGVSSDLWPLAYRLQQLEQPTFSLAWSHRLYQSPEGKRVEVIYSKEREKSEELAKKFLNETVVGFDMEWPMLKKEESKDENLSLKKRVALIQVASLDTIALFHIAHYKGETTDTLIAPSLRKLIESASIAKTGVAINSADFGRLRKFFGLKPRGAFELSHLHRLITFARDPKDGLSTRLIKLALLVELHLGLPLPKGDVRVSNWSKELSQEQKDYAASDAYAGFMLYHCMNAKRKALRPVPGLPIFEDEYAYRYRDPEELPPIKRLLLYSAKKEERYVYAQDFFNECRKDSNKDVSGQSVPTNNPGIPEARKNETKKSPKTVQEPLDPVAQILYNQLSERRKTLAQANGVALYLVANNSVLRGLAQQSPRNNKELLKVKGLGKTSMSKYGADWLEVIAQHRAVHGDHGMVLEAVAVPTESQQMEPIAPTPNTRRRRADTQESLPGSPAFGPPLQRTPALHTGLSFTLADTKLDANDTSFDVKYKDIERLDLTGDAPLSPMMTGAAGPSSTLTPAARPERNSTPGTSRWSLNSSSSSEDSLVLHGFQTPPSRSPSALKRKREGLKPAQSQLLPSDSGPQVEEVTIRPRASPPPAPLSPRTKIFRNKLYAFSKLVTRKLGTRPASTPIVSESTLDLIATRIPRTAEELSRIPGIEEFNRACQDVQHDLLRNIIKFAPAQA